ncbi:hypothetical protein [Apilactobacillus timberlakei]|uniref:Lipoprotein n=1 Tax=Apilactobacillus timberlakei TaxID=2008380 RepID=A0ABY2YRS9_9LACO|nr:hypothetical protein [Apilactobacillus timberlakei]TPR12213.1 hypothetical protein DY048_07965 [Apilactobacillus timberlakei]TPR12498.1 hypothetical protein DY052_09180 [Apilactobacillus timberlakei]
MKNKILFKLSILPISVIILGSISYCGGLNSSANESKSHNSWSLKLKKEGYVFKVANNGNNSKEYSDILHDNNSKNSKNYYINGKAAKKLAKSRIKFKIYNTKTIKGTAKGFMVSKNGKYNYSFNFSDGGIGSGIFNSNSSIKNLKPLVKKEIDVVSSIKSNSLKSKFKQAKRIAYKTKGKDRKIAIRSIKQLEKYIHNTQVYNLPSILIGLLK